MFLLLCLKSQCQSQGRGLGQMALAMAVATAKDDPLAWTMPSSSLGPWPWPPWDGPTAQGPKTLSLHFSIFIYICVHTDSFQNAGGVLADLTESQRSAKACLAAPPPRRRQKMSFSWPRVQRSSARAQVPSQALFGVSRWRHCFIIYIYINIKRESLEFLYFARAFFNCRSKPNLNSCKS